MKKAIYYLITIVICAVICLIVLEAGLQVVSNFRTQKHLESERNKKREAFEDKDWEQKCQNEWIDISLTPTEFSDFVHWRNREYRGECVNIDTAGVRKTWNPAPAEFGADRADVFCYGGSTMFGAGVRDDFTIPSLLSKKLNAERPGAVFTNFGSRAYTFEQEVIHLTLRLRDGDAPDYVIFYDGVNEVFGAYINGAAGGVFNSKQLALLIDNTVNPSALFLFKSLLSKSKTHRAFSRVREAMRGGRAATENAGLNGFSDSELDSLASDIVREYKKSAALVDRLSNAYGFRYTLFWQPVISATAPGALTGEEKKILAGVDREFDSLYKKTYSAIKRENIKNFHDISSVLDVRDGAVFITFCHLSERGNEIVSDRIFETIGADIEAACL